MAPPHFINWMQFSRGFETLGHACPERCVWENGTFGIPNLCDLSTRVNKSSILNYYKNYMLQRGGVMVILKLCESVNRAGLEWGTCSISCQLSHPVQIWHSQFTYTIFLIMTSRLFSETPQWQNGTVINETPTNIGFIIAFH